MSKKAYSEKLRDPRWQRKRLEVMERDKWKCVACGAAEETLNVNHLRYHGDPWDAPLDELETLCEPCHAKRTEANLHWSLLDTGRANQLFDTFRGIFDQGASSREHFYAMHRLYHVANDLGNVDAKAAQIMQGWIA